MTFGPVATVAIVLAVPSPDQYSIAFFLSHTLRAVSWGLSIPLVFEENRSIEFTYNSWVVLSWWVLNLISNSVVLVTSRGFSSTDPSVLASSLLNTLQFFSNAALVLFGFLVPKHIEDVANNESAPLLHQAGSSGAMLGSSDAVNIQDWNGSGSALRSSWCERLWSWRRRRAGGAYAQLDDSLIQNDYTSSARGGSMLGTPSVIARQEAGRRAGGGGGGSRSNFFQSFLRARQPFGERTSEDGSMHASRTTSLQHHYHHHERQDSRRLSKEWSGTMASGRNIRYGGHGPVYTISIPRWVLMDNNGEVVEIDSLIEGEMYGDEEEESAPVAEGLERRPSDPHEPKDRCSSVPDIADTKVAFEIELKSAEEGDDEASSRYPSVYSVIHSYEVRATSSLAVMHGVETTLYVVLSMYAGLYDRLCTRSSTRTLSGGQDQAVIGDNDSCAAAACGHARRPSCTTCCCLTSLPFSFARLCRRTSRRCTTSWSSGSGRRPPRASSLPCCVQGTRRWSRSST